jgi:mannose-6-phosphate isomerase-like protein (cupin superfamily)
MTIAGVRKWRWVTVTMTVSVVVPVCLGGVNVCGEGWSNVTQMPVIESAGQFAAEPVADAAGQFAPQPRRGSYVEHLRRADLSVGTYCIPAGAVDDQSPHTEDEIYVVTAGAATFVDAAGAVPVRPGATIFVAAGAEHRFIDITEDFATVVVFAPPESSG